jgi:D-alanine-D-alanine ligase
MSTDVSTFGRIGVLMGGYSSERGISLKSGSAVLEALKEEGCNVVALDIQERDEQRISSQISAADLDMAFIALHGQLGEDGRIQSILEPLDIPYTGSGPAASRLALNKASTQRLLRENQIRVAPFLAVSRSDNVSAADIKQELKNPPWMVKPVGEGSSIGISMVEDPNSLGQALDLAWQYGEEALVEKFIKGRELTVGILDQTPLPVIEIRPGGKIFDFTSKYQAGQSEYIVPAPLSETQAARCQQQALKAYQLVGCRHLARIDMILDPSGVPFILEINTIPGFTATSLLPKAAKEIGYSFNQLCLALVEMAYGKKKEANRSVQ